MSGYAKTNWNNQTTPPISAENLNKIEKGLLAALGYNNAAEIRAAGVPNASLRVTLRSAYSGAIMTYDWVSTATDTDDGVTIINPTVNTVGRWVSNSVIDPTIFGAKNSANTDDVATNTAAIQTILNAVGSKQCTIAVPPGCFYDWSAIALTDYTLIVDDSGYDARAGGGVRQSYRRLITRTSNSTGSTNGNSHWITGEYHPAYIAHSLSLPGEDGARASFVAWMGTTTSPTRQGTQWTQDFTGDNKFVAVNGYDNTVSPSIATKMHVIVHPADPDNARAHGFGGEPTAGVSHEFKLAGLSTSATYLTKNFNVYYSSPTGWTGKHVTVWKVGTAVTWQRTIANDGSSLSYMVDGTNMFFHNDDGSLSGVKRKIIPKTGTVTLIKAESRGLVTNTGAAGGFVITLPTAEAGLEYEFVVTVAANMRIQPKSTDTLAGWTDSTYKEHAAGYYMQASATGLRARLTCTKDGEWSYVRFGVWTDQ